MKKYLLSFFLLIPLHAQTLVGDGVTDNTPIWNSLVAGVCNSQDRNVSIGMGRFRFASPMAAIPCSLKVVGEGPGVTQLVMDFTTTGNQAGYYVTGGMDAYGGGSLRDLTISVTNGNTIGFAVWIQAHLETNPNIESHNPHGFVLDNVIIGRDSISPFTGSFNYGVYLDGSLNATPPAGIAPGIRLSKIYRSSVSGFNILPALAYHTSGAQFVGFNCPVGNTGSTYEILGEFDDGNSFILSPCPFVRN